MYHKHLISLGKTTGAKEIKQIPGEITTALLKATLASQMKYSETLRNDVSKRQ